jgi:hypothetical protein
MSIASGPAATSLLRPGGPLNIKHTSIPKLCSVWRPVYGYNGRSINVGRAKLDHRTLFPLCELAEGTGIGCNNHNTL